MQFAYEIETPANTTKVVPKRVATPLTAGILKRCLVTFPFGCAGLVGIRILHYEHQLCPLNRDSWFTGDNVTIAFDMEYLILEGWSDFKVEAYNEDDTYQHIPVISYNIAPLSVRGIGGIPWIGG